MSHILFEAGTAYDFFISLEVLHNPANFGLRPQWAAGVRSRLAPAQRNLLKRTLTVGRPPLYWLSNLTASRKDSAAVLAALRAVEPAQRLAALYFTPDVPPAVRNLLTAVQNGDHPHARDLDLLKANQLRVNRPANARVIETILSAWAHAAEFGAAYLDALEAYAANFFAEEETRLAPVLQDGLNYARQLAEGLSFSGLIEELTQGVQIEALNGVERLLVVPSFWSNPLAYYWLDHPSAAVLVFGFRPSALEVIPGESAPAGLVHVLKALGDPTRLQILRYLNSGPQTPTQLAQLLRLRPPTVSHHLNALRVAGLVQISLQADGERRYALRRGALAGAWETLNGFLQDS